MPYGAAVALSALMGLQSLLGLVFPHAYRDAEWIRATWYGNDWVTLLLGVPVLTIAVLTAARGSARGQLVWL